jgi:surface antigen
MTIQDINPTVGRTGSLLVILVLVAMLAAAGCTTKAQTGAAAGAATGAAAGGIFGPDEGRAGRALIGAGIGAALGYIVGNEWDKYDERRIQRTLENNKTHERSAWVNPDTGKRWEAEPVRTWEKDNRIYREVLVEEPDGDVRRATAYRKPDGTWVLMD